MGAAGLSEFVDRLEQAGELLRVGAVISPEQELAEIAGRMAGVGGPALLFTHVSGCRPALAANLLATDRRACLALGIESLDELADRVRGALLGQQAPSWLDRLKWSGGASADRWQPRSVKTGACQQVVRHGTDVDLTTGPFVKSWPRERGRILQSALLISVDPVDGSRIVDTATLHLLDRDRLIVFASDRQPLRAAVEIYREQKRQMPVAVAVGGDLVYRIIAVRSLATAIEPLLLAGLLRDHPVELVRCRAVDLSVPADADYVVEGHIDAAGKWEMAGECGLSNGQYGPGHISPVFQCLATTERSTPICAIPIEGHTAGEPAVLQRIADRVLLPLAQQVAPELVAMHRPLWGGPHAYMITSIRKTYEGQATRVARALLGWTPLMTTKLLIIVDADVDPRDTTAVWSRIGANFCFGHDLHVQAGPVEPEERCQVSSGLGHTAVIDATMKPQRRCPPGERPELLVPDAATQALVDRRWREYGLPPLVSPGQKL